MHPLFFMLQWQIWLTAAAMASMHCVDHRRLPHAREARMVRSLAIRERVVSPPRRATADERIKAKAAGLGFVDGKAVRA
jgi:hypothetical protein